MRAIEAGIDQVLFSPDTDAAIAAVRAAVMRGRVSMARIDEAYERISICAQPREVRETKIDITADDIARRAITLVRDRENLLPLKRARIHSFGEELRVPLEWPDGEIDVLLLAARPRSGAGKIEVPEEAKRIARARPKTTVAVSFGSPYVLDELGDISTFVCAYGVQPVLQRAAARALVGKEEMRGKLPVKR